MILFILFIFVCAAIYYGHKELKFRRGVTKYCDRPYKEVPREEIQQYRRELREAKQARSQKLLQDIADIKNPNRHSDSPPPAFLYGVGGSTNLPNPAYIAWYIEKYGYAPNMPPRDDSYDGFLE